MSTWIDVLLLQNFISVEKIWSNGRRYKPVYDGDYTIKCNVALIHALVTEETPIKE